MPVKNEYQRMQLFFAIGMAAIAATGPQLEEIVITARKEDESSQRVPITVTALSGADLQKGVVFDVQDLQEHVTGLVVAPNSQGAPRRLPSVPPKRITVPTDLRCT
jgi:outer membrane cobalamin receptor